MKKSKQQLYIEEMLNSYTHGIATLFSIIGLIILIIFSHGSNKDWMLFSNIIYGSSLIILYPFSTLYHGTRHQKAKRVFRILDHCSIFLLLCFKLLLMCFLSLLSILLCFFYRINCIYFK